jgi:ABC-type branched-subunit amino acid transport system ATPase component
MRERARELAAAVGLGEKVDTLVGSLSHGEQRQLEVGMARAGDPKLMLLDEPASGLSRGERVALTDLLLELDPSITLILIEHDMDVALRVAGRVTMMHDGRKMVEGTPDEIRANEMVHELYLGGRVAHAEGEAHERRDAGARGAHHGRRPALRQGPRRLLRARHVLQGVSFDMGREPVSLIGRNGMGKTTLCNAIMQIRPPSTQGSILFEGRELVGLPVLQGGGHGHRLRARRAGGCSSPSRWTSTCGWPPRAGAGRTAGTSTRSTSCSPAWPTPQGRAARSCRVASSRCSRSGGRCSATPSS